MLHASTSLRRRLLLTGAMPVMLSLFAAGAHGQAVEITDARTTGVETATAGADGGPADVTVSVENSNSGSFTLTTPGPALTLNSDNALISGGPITISDVDNATGILVDTSAARTGSLSVTGNITVDETTATFSPTDDDGDRITDGKFAGGTGRTGILISGTDTFTGPVNIDSNLIRVEGNDSAGIRFAQSTSIFGDVNLLGSIATIGDNARGIALASDVTGNVTIGSSSGGVSTLGEGASSIEVAGDVSDRLTIQGNVANTGYRTVGGASFPSRQSLFVRELLDDEDTLEAGSAVSVSGNVDGGIYLSRGRNDEGVAVSNTAITQIGSAAAVLIAGDGTQIIVGRVADITDTADANFNSDLQYSLVNEAQINGTSVLDDRNGTALRIADATLTDGFNNLGAINAQTYRSPNTGDAATNMAGALAISTGVDIGANADLSTFNNEGTISALSTEAIDLAFADQDNPLAANPQLARGISIDAAATVNSLTNLNTISAGISGRDGQAYALVDASGTLAVLDNQGFIRAVGSTSDNSGTSATSFTLVAVDLSANTTGVTLTQSRLPDATPDNGIDTATPLIQGEVRLGTGDDLVDVQSGNIIGNVRFGDGADVLTIAESAFVGGSLFDNDDDLTLNVAGTLAITDATPITITGATFSETATFRPSVDGATNEASTLTTPGTVTFEDGASVSLLLNNVIGSGGTFTLVDAGTLTINGDEAALQSGDTPFLYNVDVNRGTGAGANTLTASLALKDTQALGLDGPQAGVFAETFNAISADDDLGSAFTAITEETAFNAAYNQLMPEFGASVARFVHSNTSGATGAVSTHLNNARVSDEQPGGVWIEEFAYFADRELAGLSEAYRGYGFGFTGGFDTAIGPFHTAGINLGFAATEVEDVLGSDDPLAVRTFQTGIYAGYERGNLGIDLYAGGGYNDIESRRKVSIGNYTGFTEGQWGGTHLNASVTAGYDFNFGEKYYMRPSVNLSYLALTEDSYTETGSDAIRFMVDDRDANIGTATAMMNFGARYGGERVWWSPAVRFGLINEFEGAGITTSASFFNTQERIILAGQEFPETGALFGFSIAAGSKYSSFGFDYDADIRDGYNHHIARLVLRLLF